MTRHNVRTARYCPACGRRVVRRGNLWQCEVPDHNWDYGEALGWDELGNAEQAAALAVPGAYLGAYRGARR